MTSSPLVSVVIPAFNAARFLAETITSVLEQTYSPIEVLVVDDGSTDETPTVIAGFSDHIGTIRQANEGVAGARNTGLWSVQGEYVCFLDADDWLFPTCIERKVETLEANLGAGACFSWVEVTDEVLTPSGLIFKGTSDENALPALLSFIPPAIPCPSNVLIRTELVREAGGFDPRLGTAADFDMWLRLAQRTRVSQIEEVLIRYRRHEGAMFHDLGAYLADMTYIIDKHRVDLGKLPEWRQMLRAFHWSVAGEYKRRGQYLRMLGPLLKHLKS